MTADRLHKYTAHLESDKHPGFTACGETPQGWQFSDTDLVGGHAMPPYDWDPPKPGDVIRQCQACFRIARDYGRSDVPSEADRPCLQG